MGNQLQCFNIMYSDDLRNMFSMEGVQVKVIGIIGPVGLVFCLVNILMILMIKSLNEPPSDILLFISVLTAVKIALYFATLIYNDIYPPNGPVPPNFDQFCLSTGTIDAFCESSKVIGTVIFCAYYISKIKNPLKAWISEHKEVYMVSLFFVTVATCVFFFTNNIGISIYGYCSIKFSETSQLLSIFFALSFIVTLLVSSIIFLKYLQKVSTNDLTFRKYFRYYFKFLIVFSCNQLVIIFSHTAITFTCSLGTDKTLFDVSLVLDKISILLNPIFIFIVLTNHPRFKKVMLIKVIRVIAKKWRLLTLFSRRQSESGYVDEDVIVSTNRNAVLIELNNLGGIDSSYVSQLKNKNRACFLATILGCLVVEQQEGQQMMSRESALVGLSPRESQIYFNPALSYQSMNKFKLNQNMTDFYHEIFLHKLPVVGISFTTYCPTIFEMLKRMDSIQNIKGLIPQLNEKQIIQDSSNEGDGGRSGQFFFFNYDRSFILKTLNQKQKNILLSRLQQFFNHFVQEPQSFIVKVYSLFTTKNQSTDEECHFMLMGNILRSINRQFVIKVYDLKGSSHHRQVLKNSNNCKDEIVVSTLKDLDFIKIQQKIWLNEVDSAKVKSILTSDASFLCKNGLIDYSLLVVKVNLDELLAQEPQEELQSIRFFKSKKQPSIAYVFGIIDYLQTWNIKKRGQKWYKSLFAKAATISSQNPKFYFERFTKQVITDFFP